MSGITRTQIAARMRRATAARTISAAGAALLAAALAACSAGSPSPAPRSSSPAAAHSAAASGPAAITTTTTTDPCQLVTPSEASALTGASFGPGTERAIGPGKTCVYGGNTKNVFMVDVFQGSASELQQVKDQVVSQVTQGAQMTPIPVSGLGDQATAWQLTTNGFNAASIFVLKGTSAIYLVDEVTGSSAPTTAALTATARAAAGRLP